ncbi:MAG: DUF2306 domain-containing protein [Myxococcota bacterium]
MRALRRLPRPLVMLALFVGSLFITWSSLVYFNDDEYAPFVLEKLPLAREELFLFALKVHVVAAALALPGCLLLVSMAVLKRFPRFHRWLGRVTGVAVLFALLPSGFYLSLFAKGGLPSTLGFMATGAIMGVGMVQGVRTARAGRFVEHRRWVLHVLAQMGVAVLSRAMLFGFDAAGVEEIPAYLVSLWLPVVGCAVFVEVLSARSTPVVPRRNHHEAPVAALHPHPGQPVLRGAAG